MNSRQTLDDAVAAARSFADLTTQATDADLGKQTPCEGWSVADLLDHAHVATLNFTTMARGGEADWELQPPESRDRAADLREAIGELATAWSADDAPAESAGMAVPEFSLHAWDLATAIGADTSALDQDVARRAHEVMKGMLTDDQRSPAFGPEQEAPEGANAVDSLAAFAGRRVG